MLDNIAQLLGTSLNLYGIYRMKRRRADMATLQTKWGNAKGTIVTLTKGITLCEYNDFLLFSSQGAKYFETGYCPMLLEVRWPRIVEEPTREAPVVFMFWCSGSILCYMLRLDSYDGTLPFEVLSEPENR